MSASTCCATAKHHCGLQNAHECIWLSHAQVAACSRAKCWKTRQEWMRGRNIASSSSPARLFRSHHVWAHCSASDRLHASSLQSEEEEQDDNESVCSSTSAFDGTNYSSCFQDNMHMHITFRILSTDTHSKHTTAVFKPLLTHFEENLESTHESWWVFLQAPLFPSLKQLCFSSG